MAKKTNKDFSWLLHQASNPIIYLSSDHSVLDINEKALDLFNFPKKGILGKPISSLFAHYGLDISFSKKGEKIKVDFGDKKNAKDFDESKQILDLSWKIRKASNEDQEGVFIYSEEEIDNVGNCLDLDRIMSCMPGYVYWVDKNNIYLGCNENNARFLGLKSRKEIVGMSYSDLGKRVKWLAVDVDLWAKGNLEVISTGKPRLDVEEKSVLMPDGTERFFLSNLMPLFNKKKNIVGAVGVSIDITERKLMERELRLTRKRAQKAEDSEKGMLEKTSSYMKMLAGGIAHEVRTPLAIIGINSDLLKINKAIVTAEDKCKKQALSCIKSIKYAVKLASHIVDNILIMLKTLSYEESVDKEFDRLSMFDDLNNLLSSYPFLDHERSLVEVDYSGLKEFAYMGEGVLTLHVLFSLMKNALRCIKEEGKGDVKITLEDAGDYNNLKFIDTSSGMTKKQVEEVFNQFGSEKKEMMSGIGLFFARVVMQLYGGDISCKSKKDEYTEFTLSFPKIAKN